MKKKSPTYIPNSVLPPGSKRITNEDGDRVWLIRGMEFPSKRAWFQYLKDAAMMAKSNPNSAVSETKDGSTAAPQEEIKSAVDA